MEKANIFFNKNISVLGSIPAISNDKLIGIIQKLGGIYSPYIIRDKTDYLILCSGDEEYKEVKSSVVNKWIDSGSKITIISEIEFINFLCVYYSMPIEEIAKKYIFSGYIVLDIETTGFSSTDKIIEISAIKVNNDQVVDEFSTLVNPDMKIPQNVIDLTGITNEMVEDMPYISDVIEDFLEFIEAYPLLAHNASFDMTYIKSAVEEYTGKKVKNQVIDTLEYSRRKVPSEDHKLHTLCEYFGVINKNEHRGLSDCYSLLKCYQEMQKLPDIERQKPSGNGNKNKKYADIKGFNTIKAKDIVVQTTMFDNSHPFYGKVCVITGNLNKFNREKAMQLIANAGGLCNDNVTRKTDYLITGDIEEALVKDGKSSKQKKAEEYISKGLAIKIINEDIFISMIGELENA